MTAQFPAVAHLLAAHERAVEAALATTPVPVAGQWTVVRDKHADQDAPLALVQGDDPDDPGEDYSYGVPVIVLAADWQDEAEANLWHIALHDPASVLLRVAEERNILAEHAGTWAAGEPEYDHHYETAIGPTGRTRYIRVADDTPVPPYMCATCPDPGWPCRTVLGLAKAWGWKEQHG